MMYSREEFFALIEAVEDDGGEHLDKTCEVRRYEFVGSKSKPFIPPSHRDPTLFLVPYEAADKRGLEMGTQAVEACAVEDDMGRWPRFGGDRYAGPEHYIEPKDDDDG